MVEVGGYLLYWLVFSFPLGFFGMYFLMNNLIAPKWYNSRGYIKISKLSANNRWKTFWGKPEQETTREGAYAYFIKHKKEVFPFVDKEGTTTLEGSTMRAFYDVEGDQINIKLMEKYMPQVAPRMLDSMMKRIWNAAKASAFIDQKRILILIVITMLVAGAAAGIGVINFQNEQKIMGGLQFVIDKLNTTVSNTTAKIVTSPALTPVT